MTNAPRGRETLTSSSKQGVVAALKIYLEDPTVEFDKLARVAAS